VHASASARQLALSVPPEVLTLLWDAVPLGICLLGAEQTVIFANRTAARLFASDLQAACAGQALSDLLGQRLDLSDSLRATGIVKLPDGPFPPAGQAAE
jgi:two-component system sensor histidine kinase/response regulator